MYDSKHCITLNHSIQNLHPSRLSRTAWLLHLSYSFDFNCLQKYHCTNLFLRKFNWNSKSTAWTALRQLNGRRNYILSCTKYIPWCKHFNFTNCLIHKDQIKKKKHCTISSGFLCLLPLEVPLLIGFLLLWKELCRESITEASGHLPLLSVGSKLLGPHVYMTNFRTC